MEFTTSKTSPKLSLSTLDIKSNYYIVPANGVFNYFPIKIEADTLDSPIMRFEKAPPLLVDGVVIVSRKLYEVSADDIFRGVIKKFKEITTQRDNDGSGIFAARDAGNTGGIVNDSESSSDDSLTTGRSPSLQHSNKQGAGGSSQLEINEDVDSAWEEQIDSLLDLVSSKEGGEWEVTDSA